MKIVKETTIHTYDCFKGSYIYLLDESRDGFEITYIF
jgi:hypothetical protein